MSTQLVPKSAELLPTDGTMAAVREWEPETAESRRFPILRSLFALAFFAVLAVPVFVMMLRQPGNGKQKLGGVENTARPPELSFSAFLDGAMQEQFTNWLSAHIGLRGWLIRTDNQLNVSLFGFNQGRTVLGKNRYLFEGFYLDDWNGLHPVDDGALEQFVSRLAALKRLLAERQVPLLLFLTPSKVRLYQENVPDRFRLSTEGPGIYERFLKLLQKNEIPVFDGIEFAKKLKAESPYPVFPPGGAHWTSHTSCKAGEGLTRELAKLLGKKLPELQCDPSIMKEHPHGIDMDLAELSNIWTTSRYEIPLPYPKVTVRRSPDDYLPKLLFIGDSFLWTFFYYLEKRPVYQTRDFFYYYQAQQRYRKNQRRSPKVPIDKSKIDWPYVFSRDAIIIELNEVRIREGGFGFVEDALRALGAPVE